MKSLNKHIKQIAFFSLSAISFASSAACFEYKALANQMINSLYGNRYHPVHHVIKMHQGVDMQGTAGTPLFAAISGTVTTQVIGGGGNNLVINGPLGKVSYMHMTKFLANNGQKVSAGEVIGTVGNTGVGTAAHLHFEYYNKAGVQQDPKSYLFDATMVMPAIDKDRWPAGTPNPKNVAFPVISPVGASECSGAPKNIPAAGASTSGTAVPDAPTDPSLPDSGTGTPNTPLQNFPSTDNVSLRDFFAREVNSRYPNPQWHLELLDPGDTQREQAKLGVTPTSEANAALPTPTIHMLRELNILMALRNMITAERFLQKEQIQMKHAAMLSLDAADYSEKIIGMAKMQTVR